MSKTKGLKKSTYWIAGRKIVTDPETGKNEGLPFFEQRLGYLYEKDGLVFGLSVQGPKVVIASEILTGLRYVNGVTLAGTAEKLEGLTMNQVAEIYWILDRIHQKAERTGDWSELEPGMRTLGGDRVLEILNLCAERNAAGSSRSK